MTFWHTLEALKGLNSIGRAGQYGESALEDGGRTLVRVNPDQRILKATHKSCGRAVELEALYCSSAASCIKGQHQQPGGSQGGPEPPIENKAKNLTKQQRSNVIKASLRLFVFVCVYLRNT